MSDDWRARLKDRLEPVLGLTDPRPQISSYHDMPYALFHYPPRDEFAVRAEVTMLETRLVQQKGKRVTRISLARCLDKALDEHAPVLELAASERILGMSTAVETVHAVLSEYCPLVDLVAELMPPDPDPTRDIVFVTRTGALFPVYRTFSLLEDLKGRLLVPAVLFYPGCLDGAAGLRFMEVLDAEHNYRPKIF